MIGLLKANAKQANSCRTTIVSNSLTNLPVYLGGRLPCVPILRSIFTIVDCDIFFLQAAQYKQAIGGK